MLAKNESRLARSAIVIGGSLGGLFAGTLLRSAGVDVTIYERSPHDLDSRGGGIVLQPEVAEVVRKTAGHFPADSIGVMSRDRIVLNPDGTVRSKQPAPQTQTSWSRIYTTMRSAFGPTGYLQGKELDAVSQDADKVTARFSDGTAASADLLVGADGNGSTVRRLLWPGFEPRYAGYLAWRGLVPESEMPIESRSQLHGNFGFANAPGSHMLGYLVPGDDGDTREGHRYYNWVWYRVADEEQLGKIMTDRDVRQRGFSLPEGKIADTWREHVYEEAGEILPPSFREIVRATEEPFAQAIRDLAVDRMVKGRAILLGDAASVPRPHTAASTSKAASDALALVARLVDNKFDLRTALDAWEPPQLVLAKELQIAGKQSGDYLLHHRVGRMR